MPSLVMLPILLFVVLFPFIAALSTPPSPFPPSSNPALLQYPTPSHLPGTVYLVSYTTRQMEEQLVLTTLAGALAKRGLTVTSSTAISLLYKWTGNMSDPTYVYWQWYQSHYPSVHFNDSLATAPLSTFLQTLQSSIDGYFLADYPTRTGEADNVNSAVSMAGVTTGAIVITPQYVDLLTGLNKKMIADMRAFTESTFLHQFAPLNQSTAALPWPFSRQFISSQTPTKAAQFLSDWSMFAGAVQLHHIPTATEVLKLVPQKKIFSWLGWTADNWSENGMTSEISQAGGVVWAADTLSNLATHAFFIGDLHPPPSTPVLNKGKHTVAFLFTDGDSLCADTVGLIDSTHWSNPRRGDFALTWGINPSLAHLSPGSLEFFYNTSTPNDGIAGFAPGYAYPSFMTEDQRWLYAEAAGETMNAAGLKVNYLIDFNFSSQFFGPLLRQFSVDAVVYFDYPNYYLLTNNRSGSVVWVDQKPAIAVRESLWQGHSTPTSVAALINKQLRDETRVEGYSVVAVHLWSQTVDTVGEAVKALDNEGVVVVKLDELVRLMTANVPQENRVVGHVERRRSGLQDSMPLMD